MKLSLVSLIAFAVACGGSVEADPNAQAPGEPPPPPNANDLSPPSTESVSFAIDELFVGENGTWRGLGFNLDDKTTTKDSTNVCARVEGSPATNQVDGTFGIDNAWGATVVPIMQSLLNDPLPSESVSNALASGSNSVIFSVGGYRDGDVSAVGLAASAFVGHGASIESKAPAVFSTVYQSSGKLVARGSLTPLEIDLPITTQLWGTDGTVSTFLELDIHDAIVTFDTQNPDGSVNGTIGGVLRASELIESALAVALDVAPKLCSDPSPFVGIASQLTQASDIFSNGTSAPGATCDGVSIGLAFHAARIPTPTHVVTSAPRVSCP